MTTATATATTEVPTSWDFYKKDIKNLVWAIKLDEEPRLEVHTPKISNVFGNEPLHTLYLPEKSRWEDLTSYVHEYKCWYKKRIVNAYDFMESEVFEESVNDLLGEFDEMYGDKFHQEDETIAKHQIIWVERHLFKIASRFKSFSPLVRKPTIWG